ncbi:MAG: ribosome biogenesis protein [Nitrososphaerales archaeon]
MKLNFVLVESALELVPKEILRSPAVTSDSRRRGVDASRILLDRSLHHSAMTRLRDSEKRGRPDLVHAALLSVTGTPLYLDGSVRVFVHTNQDAVLELAERTRIPKSYFRFRGLVEKLLSERSDEGLVKAYGAGVRELLRKTISPDRVFGLSVQGRQTRPEELAKAIVAAKNPCVVVGGFPRGHFSQETLALVDELVRIHERPLEAHVVASRIVYEVEKASTRTND